MHAHIRAAITHLPVCLCTCMHTFYRFHYCVSGHFLNEKKGKKSKFQPANQPTSQQQQQQQRERYSLAHTSTNTHNLLSELTACIFCPVSSHFVSFFLHTDVRCFVRYKIAGSNDNDDDDDDSSNIKKIEAPNDEVKMKPSRNE